MSYSENQSGRLEIYMGPMFSGKSSRLIHKLCTLADVGFRVLYLNHSDDNRDTCGDNIVSTHSSQYHGLSEHISSLKVASLQYVDIREYDVIGVDESQFFDDLVPAVSKWIEQDHKYVICVGLDGDAFKRPFGHLLELIPYADIAEKMTAMCHSCLENAKKTGFASLNNAPFTRRLNSESSSQKLIGGSDKYIAVCRHHSNH